MLGRGGSGSDKSRLDDAHNHQSAPLSSLTDPSTFAPPPKRVDYSRDPTASSSAHLTGAAQRRQQEEEANKPPPGPYRANTTGIDTSNLPKPPAFRPGAAPPPPPARSAGKPKPNLPPRLPPRQNSNPNEFAPTPPPTYNEATEQKSTGDGFLNQGALNRLGQAGVSVPGLGLGRNASPPVPPRQISSTAETPVSPPPTAGHGGQLGELQGRFAKMSTTQQGGEAPKTGTTWAEKQAAMHTASSIRDDPSKVSAADIRGAASTASNFQQRHGAQVASGWRAANGLNSKYGITGKVNGPASSTSAAAPSGQPTPPQSPVVASASGGIGKKPAPPPPPKRKAGGAVGAVGTSDEPPPIPLGSKPKF